MANLASLYEMWNTDSRVSQHIVYTYYSVNLFTNILRVLIPTFGLFQLVNLWNFRLQTKINQNISFNITCSYYIKVLTWLKLVSQKHHIKMRMYIHPHVGHTIWFAENQSASAATTGRDSDIPIFGLSIVVIFLCIRKPG